MLDLGEVADELAWRLVSLFLSGPGGVVPSLARVVSSKGAIAGHLLFHEFFHGDTGEGLCASHQTGWTALVADLLPKEGR